MKGNCIGSVGQFIIASIKIAVNTASLKV